MHFPTLSLVVLGLSASTSALPTPPRRQQCTSTRTVSDPGFYAAGFLPSADFSTDPPYYENQILEFQPSFSSPSATCTLFGNFEAGLKIRVKGNAKPVLDVYQRHSSTEKKLIGTFANLPPLDENGALTDIVSAPLGTVKCSAGMVFEFQVKLEEPGDWAGIAFEEDGMSGFDLLAC
ncbi:hypothetical protein BU23DRAFT_602977 [Bimuria novae-zelandiae CBS 107.79]|uniref:Ubiquitin 3 binding protein But2 C-terminal domain-containing protein n=1 Tax=Bimuria novae-zelandiae CBS 107.79 TaxID=1447943 RepID=A0A6A5USD1_9PLEO|nr:hypothetical protein BU23DRAFT_602977 [Bimuria novae-zelandiae CBS 107.79]